MSSVVTRFIPLLRAPNKRCVEFLKKLVVVVGDDNIVSVSTDDEVNPPIAVVKAGGNVDENLDNSGSNGVINGNGNVDLATKTAFIEWVKPMEPISDSLM